MLGLAALGGVATGTGLWYMFVYRPKKMAMVAPASKPAIAPSQKPSTKPAAKPAATPASAPSTPKPSGPVERPESLMNASQGSVVDQGEFHDQNGLKWAYTITVDGLSFSWTTRYVGPSNKTYGMPAPMRGTAGSPSAALEKAHDAVVGWVERRTSEAADQKLGTVFG